MRNSTASLAVKPFYCLYKGIFMSEYLNIGLPPKITINKKYDSIEIIRQWFSYQFLIFAGFSVLWCYQVVINNMVGGEIAPISIIFLLPGVGIAYYALLGFVNKTYIYVSKTDLKVSHKPLPWIGGSVIQASDIKQLYGREKYQNDTKTYEVHVITHSGEDTKLLSGLDSSEQALYIEQEIEKYLSIKNVPVRGELG
tara:strand:- start:4175 stop:4765 length:591 start_codon:yes stop_codon:yes gene_type:complete